MVQQDLDAYYKWFKLWKLGEQPKKVVLCSPNEIQMSFFNRDPYFENAELIFSKIAAWNLYSPCPYPYVDLIVACNVFHYLEDPEKAFGNVFAACKQFWIQDLVSRRRGGKEEFGNDGDQRRYILEDRCPELVPATMFNLSAFKDRLLAFNAYDGGSYELGCLTVHFVAQFKGDL